MSTVVSILDRDEWGANTDVIVLVDPARRLLTWIPRDLWCPSLGDRINRAFARGGHERLLAALHGLGFRCQHALTLRRAATERALSDIAVEVPVDEPIDLHYPLNPTRPIEEGRKAVSFRPPCERLEGERVHQWIGARYSVGRASSDLERIARQQVFLRALLQQGFDFGALIADPGTARSTGEEALDDLRQVDPDWRMETFSRVRPATIDGKMVLVRISRGRHLAHWAHARLPRWLHRLRRRAMQSALLRN